MSTAPAGTIYMNGAIPPALVDHAHRPNLGILVQPGTANYLRLTGTFDGRWGYDNGCFAQGDTFDADAWFATVRELPSRALFVVAPDVVGDATATWDRSAPWLDRIRSVGQPAALVAQDGMEHTTVAWDAFDCLFIGGSTEWKLGDASRTLIAQAKAHDKWVHVGRVNSWKRYNWCIEAGADSADGTYLAFGPKVNMPKMLGWLDRALAERLARLPLLP
jgi:hypothetical protein